MEGEKLFFLINTSTLHFFPELKTSCFFKVFRFQVCQQFIKKQIKKKNSEANEIRPTAYLHF